MSSAIEAVQQTDFAPGIEKALFREISERSYAIERIDGKIPSYFPLDFGKPGLYNNSIIANATVALGVLKEAYLKNGSDAGEQVRERERVCVYVCMCVCVCMYMCVSV